MEGSFRILSYLGKSDGLSSIFTSSHRGKKGHSGKFPADFCRRRKSKWSFFFFLGKQTIHICIVMVRIFPHSSALFGLVSYHDP